MITPPIRTRRAAALVASVVTAVSLAGCAQGSTTSSAQSSGTGSSAAAAAAGPVILIGTQPFGDRGPMDDMAAGLAKCASDDGLKVKKVVALNASEYDSTIQTAAQSGYKLILTTFPQISTATKSVATSFPGVKFGAVYQFINQPPATPVSNVWSTSFDVSAAAYVQGAMAAKVSKAKKIGFIVGDLDPTILAEVNAYIDGAKSVDPDTAVYWANANTFIDPAKGKDLAQGMIDKGVDVVSTAAGQTQLGALDAAKAAGILFFGDNGDNAATYPKGFISDLRSELGKNVVDACKSFADGTFEGGKQTVYDLKNGGADVDTALITKWGEASGRQDDATALTAMYKDLVNKISSGSVTVPTRTTTPKSAG